MVNNSQSPDPDARDLACKLYEASGREADLHAERWELTKKAAEHSELARKATERWGLTEVAKRLKQTKNTEIQELTKAITAPKSQPSSGQQRLLILVRHASRTRVAAKSEKDHRMEGWPEGQRPSPKVEEVDGKSRKSGWQKTRDIAIALAEKLEVEGVQVSHILHSTHTVAAQTAKVYAAVLWYQRDPATRGLAKPELASWLTPEKPQQSRPGDIEEELKKRWWVSLEDQPGAGGQSGGQPGAGGQSEGQAIILVGHQPQLTEIANTMLRANELPLPVGNSEAACLQLDSPRRLLWLLTEKGDSLAAELKDKVKSKVDIAKFFLGALAVNASLLVNATLWNTAGPFPLSVLWLGANLIFLGLLFAIATLFGYDALNMPSTFWGEATQRAEPKRGPLLWILAYLREKVFPSSDNQGRADGISRPPSEATVVLYYEMVKVWKCFFIPAMVCSVAGVACFLLTLVMMRVDKLLMPSPALKLQDILTREMAWPDALLALLALLPSEFWGSAAIVLVLLGLFLGVSYHFFLPALLLYFVLERVVARLPALLGTGAAVSQPATLYPFLWCVAVLVFIELALDVHWWYQVKKPRLGVED